ncbi:MAG: hypothetical protein WC058_15645 [Phycisphaeraceae bacterium]
MRVPLNVRSGGLRLIVEQTWGDSDEASVFAFDVSDTRDDVRTPSTEAMDGPRFRQTVEAIQPSAGVL